MSSLDARRAADEEMPERIWAVKSIRPGCVVSFDTPSLDYNNEYIRADLANAKDAEIARLRHLLKQRDRMAEASRKFWVRAAKKAMAPKGDFSELRNRVELSEAEPMQITQSGGDDA